MLTTMTATLSAEDRKLIAEWMPGVEWRHGFPWLEGSRNDFRPWSNANDAIKMLEATGIMYSWGRCGYTFYECILYDSDGNTWSAPREFTEDEMLLAACLAVVAWIKEQRP